MAERRSMSQGLGVHDNTSSELEREFIKEGNIAKKKESNIAFFQKKEIDQPATDKPESIEDMWFPVTFRLPRSLIAELGLYSAQQRAKGRIPWKKQEIIALFLRQGLQQTSEK